MKVLYICPSLLTSAPSTVILYRQVAQTGFSLPKSVNEHGSVSVGARAYAYRHNHNGATLTPRVKHACRLYASAAVATKEEAAEAVGLNPTYFNVITNPNHKRSMPEAIALIDEIQQRIEDKTVELSSVVQLVAREALQEVRSLMKNSQNEAIKLKAASDILDRNPDTSKTQKIQASSFSLSGEDAQQLSAALVAAANAQKAMGAPITGDYVRIPVELDQETEDAGQRLLTTTLRQVDEGKQLGASGEHRVHVETLPVVPEGTAQGGPAAQDSAPERPIIGLVK